MEEEKKQFVKLYCDNYDCDTHVLVSLKDDENISDYYICPVCEGMIFKDDNTELITI